MGLREVQSEGHAIIDRAFAVIQREVEAAVAAHGDGPVSGPTAAVMTGEGERVVAGHEQALAEELAALSARAYEEGWRRG